MLHVDRSIVGITSLSAFRAAGFAHKKTGRLNPQY